MKLLFLMGQETDIHQYFSFYNFLPYKYGPYSFYADYDLDGLKKKGFLNEDEGSLSDEKEKQIDSLTNKLPLMVREKIQDIIEEYKEHSDNALIKQVYSEYPFFTLMSKRKKNEKQRPVSQSKIYTIGYEGISLDKFLRTLIEEGIKRIIDVRKNPLSRKFGFSESSLRDYCNKVNIEYVNVPEVGIPSERRNALDDRESYEELFEIYNNEILCGKSEIIEEIIGKLEDVPSALLCFEENPELCHRSHLAQKIHSLSDLEIKHLEF